MRLIARSGSQPGQMANTMRATSATGRAPVAAYALLRPDRKLSVLLLNKAPRRARPVAIEAAGHRQTLPLTGPVTVEQLSSAQYVWHQAGERGYAHPDRPPARRSFRAGRATTLTLPPLSLTVLRTEQAPYSVG